MPFQSKPASGIVLAGLVLALSGQPAPGQTIQSPVTDIALRSGETIEFQDLWFVSRDCRSLLKGVPAVEIMDGPPGVSVSVRQAMVVPRSLGCGKAVSGGKMTISAQDVEDYSHTRMIVRYIYKTQMGDRLFSRHINVTLFPKQH